MSALTSIFFSRCFLALLLIAAILWKIKQKYDRYRRRQRLFVEMEQVRGLSFRLRPSSIISASSHFQILFLKKLF